MAGSDCQVVTGQAEASIPELLLALQHEPLESLRALRQRLPQAADAIRAASHLLGPLVCSAEGEVAGEAADLLQLVTESKAAGCEVVAEKRRIFRYRSLEVEYWDLPPTDDHLLFGYEVWPVAELFAKLLVDRALRRDADADMMAALPAVKEQSVLEVGAGVGLTGLACHAVGASQLLLTDGEERLVHALREKHGHRDHVSAALLDWKQAPSQNDQQFDVILGSDILLTVCEGHIYAPRVVGARLRKVPEARGLLMAPVRNAGVAQDVAVQELDKQGLHVRIFIVSAAVKMLEISRARLSSLGHGAVVLLVAQWFAHSEVEEAVCEHAVIDDDLAELLQLSDDGE